MKYKLFSLIQRRYQPTTPLLLLILLLSFVIRVVNFSFPAFTENEARIASRGYRLATTGKDELGRPWPFIFNSLTDYQLPLTSYVTAVGIFVFGKSDIGARVPFLFVSILLIVLSYKIAQVFSKDSKIWLTSVLIAGFSPALIFLSKIPNDSLILTTLLVLLFYLLTKEKIKLFYIASVVVLCMSVSKQSWFILVPFVFITLYLLQPQLTKSKKLVITLLAVLISLSLFAFYLNIPQGRRSLSENNFSIFTSVTISNGINKLRGQGIQSQWPALAEKIFFNKAIFVTTGVLHWLSTISPAIYFGQFDQNGFYNFTNTGALPKILLIPAVFGMVFLIKNGSRQQRLLIYLPILLTFPSIFVYPSLNLELVVVTLPFIALILSFGLRQLGKISYRVIIFLAILEVVSTTLFTQPQIRVVNGSRPIWVKPIVEDISKLSHEGRVGVSDNIVSDIIPFISWYTSLQSNKYDLDLRWPYRFKETKLKDIKVIGWENKFYSCTKEESGGVLVTGRDIEKIRNISDFVVTKKYHDSLGQEVLYLIPSGVCIN